MTFNNATIMSFVFMTYGEYQQMYIRSRDPNVENYGKYAPDEMFITRLEALK